MKRIVPIIILFIFAIIFISSCQTTGDVVQIQGDNIQIVNGRTINNEESRSATEPTQQIVERNITEESQRNSPPIWIYILLFPLFLIGVWYLYYVIKSHKNRSKLDQMYERIMENELYK